MSVKVRVSIHEFLLGLGFGLFLAVQGVFFLEKGIDIWQIGLVIGVIPATAALFEVPFGALADLRGRLFTFRLSRFAYLFGGIVLIISSTLPGLLAAAFFLGVSMALSSGTIDAWFVEVLQKKGKENEIQIHKGIFQASSAIGMVFGSVIGGYLPSLDLSIAGITKTEWNLVAVVCLSTIHLSLTFLLFPEGEIKKSVNVAHNFRKQIKFSLAIVSQNSTIKRLLTVGVLIGLTIATFEAYWQPQLLAIRPDVAYSYFGWITAGYFATAIIGPLLIGVIANATSINALTQVRVIPIAVCFLLFFAGKVTSLPSFIVVYFGFMFFFSMLNPPAFALLNEAISDDHRSTAQSLFSLTFTFGAAVASFGVSLIIKKIGIASTWQFVGLGLTAIFVGLLLIELFSAANPNHDIFAKKPTPNGQEKS